MAHHKGARKAANEAIINHIGNVLAVVSDKKEQTDGAVWSAVVVSAQDYYPFGMSMPGRSSGSYKYGFNGKETDPETGLNDFGARFYAGNLGRWLSIDPLAAKFPAWSPYNAMNDNPMFFIDPDGMQVAGPGDVIVLMAGANTFKTNSVGSLPTLANIIRQLDKTQGTAIDIFPSNYWGVDLKSKEGFDAATQDAYNYIKSNYRPGGQVVVYGYSWGGALVNHLCDRLANDKIKVDLLVTIDAAGGSQNEFVRREVSDNVVENLNIFQTVPETIYGLKTGSHGAQNTSPSGIPCILNCNYTGRYTGTPGNSDYQEVTHATLDEITHERVAKKIEETINNQ